MTMPDDRERYWAVMPAGGTGSRLGAQVPKQYLFLGGQTMIERSVDALSCARWIEQVVVVAAPGDAQAARLLAGHARVQVLARGGATRRDSVLAGVSFLLDSVGARQNDWVLVHDAARPAVSLAALERLKATLAGGAGGGLLALPVADTVKRAHPEDGGMTGERVAATVDRQGLWLAQTPQMFRLGALAQALARFPEVTDEASAMEAAGEPVRLVAGDRMNFKVTTPDDLDLMRRLLGD